MNSTLSAPAVQPRKPARSIAILERPATSDPEGWFALSITFTSIMARSRARRVESFTYLAREIPADGMGQGCRGFELEKLDAGMEPTGETYHVLVDPRDGYSSCDCIGHEKHRRCKHREGIQALLKQGQLSSTPRYERTHCSQCGGEFGPGNSGFSHCEDHRFRSAGDMKRNAPDELEAHLASIAEEPTHGIPAHMLPENRFDCANCGEYPGELPPWSDFDPAEEGIEPAA